MAQAAGIRGFLIGLVGALATAGVPVRGACALAGISHATWYRAQSPAPAPGVSVPHRERAYPNRVSAAEREEFLAELNSDEFADLSVTQAWVRIQDRRPVFSLATAHRAVAAAGLNGDRRRQRPRTGSSPAAPVLSADAPGQVWCWDITELRGPGRHRYKLYALMDLYSRKVIAHRVETTENGTLAADFISTAVLGNWHAPRTLHSDNGSPMRAASTQAVAHRHGTRLSYSRPRTSNDNPFIESLFRTVKYDIAFPEAFTAIDHARDYLAGYFHSYNTDHRHWGLNGYTPASVHDGTWTHVHARRHEHRISYYSQNPHRYRSQPTTPTPPAHTGINTPNHPPLSQTA